ncbi:MAG: hypothetical protein ACMUEM_03350 [Flavobacteriales bacterium AspAUS03]
MKAGLGLIHPEHLEKFESFKVNVKFSILLPQNLQKLITILSEVNWGKTLIIQENSIRLNSLVEKPSTSLEQLERENTYQNRMSLSEIYDMHYGGPKNLL